MVTSGFILAAPKSGEGKTTITCGIMAALLKRGLSVQPYKVGPDYVDPMLHQEICGRPSINLDSWLTEKDLVRWSFNQRASMSQVSIVEGVMGLFDGSQDPKRSGSTAEIAQVLNLPVILVVDVAKMAGSAGALVSGFANFQPGVRVAGVICNRVGSENHFALVKEAIEASTGIPVLGGIKRLDGIQSPKQAEQAQLEDWATRLAEQIETALDLDQLLTLTVFKPEANRETLTELLNINPLNSTPRIAVAQDQAFDAYYADNLELIRALGAEIVPFSPLKDASLPRQTQALYLSSRFPDHLAKTLAQNEAMKKSIREKAQMGLPILAEGGAFIYLTSSYRDMPLVGLIPSRTGRKQSFVAMGYRQITLAKNSVLGSAGLKLRGHTFHSTYLMDEVENGALAIENSQGRDLGQVGFFSNSVLASHLHFHFLSNPLPLKHFLTQAILTVGEN